MTTRLERLMDAPHYGNTFVAADGSRFGRYEITSKYLDGRDYSAQYGVTVLDDHATIDDYAGLVAQLGSDRANRKPETRFAGVADGVK